MLVEFRVKNHRSVRDEQALTMSVGHGGRHDLSAWQVEGHSAPLVPVAVLYGANASGKSNVLAALSFMREAVTDSQRLWSSDEGVPRDPFAWGGTRHAPSLFEATILVRGVRYQYGFVATDESFVQEWLYAWPNGKKQVWYERDGAKFDFKSNLRGENKLIEDVTRPNALFLSASAQHKHEQLQPISAWFRAIQSYRVPGRGSFRYPPHVSDYSVARLLQDSAIEDQPMLFPVDNRTELTLGRFRALLRNADIGIVDVRLSKPESDDPRSRSRPPRFQLKHTGDYEDAWLPLEEESRGTRTLFHIAMPILQVIQRGGILIVDELEASLHPSLADAIVRQFNDPKSNPRHAQLICTTHDTNLLGTTVGEAALYRDQVWLTEKDADGATELYPLTDFQPRKSENLERGYLQGRYGAIPFLGSFQIGDE
jgi:hypothetical protein